jgi:hypothetical protein
VYFSKSIYPLLGTGARPNRARKPPSSDRI